MTLKPRFTPGPWEMEREYDTIIDLKNPADLKLIEDAPKMAEMLREIYEGLDDKYADHCPMCGWHRVHKPDCKLAAFIAEHYEDVTE